MSTIIDQEWHLDKRVNIGHLLTTLVLVVAGLGVIHKMDTRLTTAEAEIRAIQQQHMTYQAATTATLVRIETKLDRVIERDR